MKTTKYTVTIFADYSGSEAYSDSFTSMHLHKPVSEMKQGVNNLQIVIEKTF